MAYTTINKSNLHMKVNLHSGTGSARNITGIGFQPDFTIVKRRDNTGVWYNTDIVRGAGKQMYLNETGGMSGSASTTEITGFNSDGFNLGTDNGVNASSGTYVSYNFLGNNTTGSSNTDGNITSTVSVNTTAGFSIVKYTGNSGGNGYSATIGHGLGVAPKFMIVKCLSHSSSDWSVYYGDATDLLKLNESSATADDNLRWYDTAPSNSVFTVGTNSDVNNVGRDYIAYCFAEKTGYSKISSYTGNGSTDGTFVYTGFKPAFVMIKHTNGTSNWTINDTGRDPTNVNNLRLFPNQSVAESSGSDSMDMLSNGFKLRSTDGGNNGSGDTYIYMAFGQSLVGSNNVPCTAR